MSRFQLRHRAALCILVSAIVAGTAGAQTPASPDMSAAERAKRDADKVFQWIRIHSDKPRKATAPAPAAGDKTQAAVARPAPARTRAPETLAEPARERTDAVRAVAPPEPALPAGPVPVQAAAEVVPDASAPMATSAATVEEESLTPLVKSAPEFPPNLMRQLRKGAVQVGFTVKPDGSVSDARAVSSSHPRLVAAAVATVAQWRFQPLRQAQDAMVELGFNLD